MNVPVSILHRALKDSWSTKDEESILFAISILDAINVLSEMEQHEGNEGENETCV